MLHKSKSLTLTDVRHIYHIPCLLEGIDLSRFPHQSISGRIVYHIEILVHVSFAQTGRVVHFVASTLGKQIGESNLTMAFE